MQQIDQGQLLASIAATSHDCIVSVDARGTILWASPATLGLLGWRPEDLAGSELAVLTPRQGGDVHAAYLDRLLAGERVDPFLDTVVRRDGSTFKASVTLGPVHDAAGAITGVTVILRDVTAHLLEQRELTQALEVSRAHFEQVATPQAILDLRGHLTSVNPAWCELFGHPEEHFTDRDLLSLVHPMDLHQAAERLDALGWGSLDSITYQGVFCDADGRSLSLLLDATALREADGSAYAVAVSARDLALVDEARRAAAVRASLYEALGRRPWAAALVIDTELRITSVTPAVTAMLGYAPTEAVRVAAWEGVVHPADSATVTETLERVRAEPWRTERFVLRARHRDGRWLWVEETVTNCLEDPDIRGLVANLRDITEQVRTEEALRLSEALHRALLETAQDGILAVARDGRTTFANARVAQILGRPLAEMYGVEADHLLGLPAWEDTAGRFELRYRHPDGHERTLEVARNPLMGADPEPLGSLVTVADVTEARLVERTLRRQALHDPLTGLPNRYLFLDRLETAAARHLRTFGRGTAVLYLDLDHFKPVNDGHGHQVGDEVLQEVARRVAGAVRATDTVGRLGGDEFAIICEDTDEGAAVLVAAKVLGELRRPFSSDGEEHQLGVSIGVALAPPYHVEELVRRADAAMYRAKQLGGSRVAVSRPGEAGGGDGQALMS
ncbi:PAS domain S-box protein [Nocardioides panaciterrulae]|uniref:Diguanylate cyclase (GGDEF)-like protein/PAS domain S-box-containing protein n=1 Tax=Nocardioides panaciterrulae TaxID=661492 RepID=A0A7Y9E845_9ACTN|nr:diguanylate cyclase (GGDEF)-like protein/PAS domain S-box-containing protein [Nocardioides panaciterrulae]